VPTSNPSITEVEKPLALAAANGHEAIVHLLLDKDVGANIDAANNRGRTPLLRAAEGAMTELAGRGWIDTTLARCC